jgi:hypothetical protein
MRQPTVKELAEYFRLTLEAGLRPEKDIEVWADNLISDSLSPIPDWLLNLSIDREACKARLLDAVPGQRDMETVWRMVLAHLGLAVRTRKLTEERVVRILFRWQLDRVIPKDYEGGVYGLDDAFDGIKLGWNTLKNFQQYFAEFFEPFRRFEELIPKLNADRVA